LLERSHDSTSGPLSGLVVVDFTTNISGPFATRILADLGANVVKVERPEGDDSRRMSPTRNGVSAPFIAMNRGKRSIVLDLKEAEDLKIARDLILAADVVVENMRPGKMAALGLGFDDVKEHNRRVIYCSISGYGQTGPLALRPAYDLVVQARTGIMSITGSGGGDPARVGPSIVDLSAGMWAANAICASLWKRDTLGAAQHIDTSLFEAGLAWMSLPFAQYEMTGEIQTRMGAQTPLAAPADCYPTSNGYVVLAVLNDAIWRRFCTIKAFNDLAERADLRTNELRTANRVALTRALRERFATDTSERWLEQLEKAAVPSDRLGTPDSIAGDEQARARGNLSPTHSTELDGSIATINLPVRNHSYPRDPAARSHAPGLGEHSDEIRRDVRKQ
jgi:crotonobetainyl-CoA:carnitine CoA-transferase CaiB-like acyl-CoA transferase